MNNESTLQPLQISLGVQPTTDRTRLNTNHYTFADKVRFWNGSPQKLGGWNSVQFNDNATIDGYARSMYSSVLQNRSATVVGTSSKLYCIYNSELTNITPLSTTEIPAPGSLSTDYGLMDSDPFEVSEGSNLVTILLDDADKYKVGDYIKFSGSVGFNGISDVTLNAQHKIREIGDDYCVVMVSETATSSGFGGGASVVKSSGIITVTSSAHGNFDGDRVKISGAADAGGVVADDINLEFIIRNVTTDTFDVITAGFATSSVTAAGGASTVYQEEIADGNVDEAFGSGWGVGLWGVGRWGVPQTSSSGIHYPRTWFFDRFGDAFIMTPGDQGGVYSWQGDSSTAPDLIENAPTDVNYAFISDNILVTFGHGNIPNQIFASDQGDPTQWTASSLNQVYQDIIEGADRLISHVPVLGLNLIFTGHQTYKFEKIDINAGVWKTTLLDNSIGIIAPMARVSVNDVAFWMARNNFYMWSGGNIQIIPANDQEQCTALRYVFDNINTGQLSKCFGWYNSMFHEVWFHYPSATSAECDRVIRVSLIDNSWTMDTFDRICAEYPSNLYGYPRMISSSGVLYNHEQGTDADGQPMEWALESNMRTYGKNLTFMPGIIPDSIQTGNITVNVKGYLFPQSTSFVYNNTYTVTPTTERIPTQNSARFYIYRWSGNSLGNNWNMGQWFEYAQQGATN